MVFEFILSYTLCGYLIRETTAIDANCSYLASNIIHCFYLCRNSITGSSVCAFRFQDIINSLRGRIKAQSTPKENWLPVPEQSVPRPHPSEVSKHLLLQAAPVGDQIRAQTMNSLAWLLCVTRVGSNPQSFFFLLSFTDVCNWQERVNFPWGSGLPGGRFSLGISLFWIIWTCFSITLPTGN